jgi:hypothetical protein
MENFLISWGPIIVLVIVWIIFMNRFKSQKTRSEDAIEKIALLLEDTNKLLKDIHTEIKKRG